MAYYFKLFNVFLLATVKYFYTPLYALLLGLSFIESLLCMVAGGIFGFLVFYYLSGYILITFQQINNGAEINTRFRLRKKYSEWLIRRKDKRKNKNKFTRRNKLIVKTRSVYGMWGILVLTPVLLSIPLGAFLLRKYYPRKRMAVPLMLAAIIIEGCVLCYAYWYLYDLSV